MSHEQRSEYNFWESVLFLNHDVHGFELLMPSLHACMAKLLLAEPSPWAYPLGSHIEARKAKQKLVLGK